MGASPRSVAAGGFASDESEGERVDEERLASHGRASPSDGPGETGI